MCSLIGQFMPQLMNRNMFKLSTYVTFNVIYEKVIQNKSLISVIINANINWCVIWFTTGIMK